MSDPVRVRNQPSLTTSTGLIWLVLGTFLATICVAVLLALVGLEPVTASVGVVVVTVLYVAMIVVRFAVRPGPVRLTSMASLFGAMAVVTLICVVVISGMAWGSLS
ncbi:MAG: hypothetical protein ABWX76_05155 [Leifsonia flava]